MGPTQWPELAGYLSGELKHLRGGASEVMKGFSAIAQAALKPGALDVKTKELIALAISVAVRCDDCIAFHAKAAVERGATREEILETLGMAIYMGAGPSAMYASHALGAATQFAEAKPPDWVAVKRISESLFQRVVLTLLLLSGLALLYAAAKALKWIG